MQDFGAIFGSMVSARISRRSARRQLDDEARINDVPPRPGHEKNLSEHVPSSLISLEDRVRALAVGGAPAWSRRLKRIYDLTDALTQETEAAWRKMALSARGNADRFARDWQRYVDNLDFSKLNELIDHHNWYFPTEANLAMDPRTLDYVKFGGEDYRRQHLDTAWALANFPADLNAALSPRPTLSESAVSH